MIETTDVYYFSTGDPDFKAYVRNNDVLINGEFTLDIDAEGWLFRSVTSTHNGIPSINLATCRRFEIATKINLTEVDLTGIMQMPFIEVIGKLAKKGGITK